CVEDQGTAGAVMDVGLSTDDLIRSIAGPMARVLRADLSGGEFVVVVERDGEIEEISLWEAIRQHRVWARASAPAAPFSEDHELLNWIPRAKREQALTLE